MQNLVPAPIAPMLDFEPVPRKYRYDGWTAERQRAFIAALAETGSVKAAATRINMSYEGAYYLRRQPGADGFRAAWNAALDHGVQRLVDIAIDRAIEGVSEPIFWRGEQVGEKRRYSDRLLMFNIRHHLPDRSGTPGLRPGTRSRATIEREAAENCPVCKARAAEEAEPDAADLRAQEAYLQGLLKRYTAKVRYERCARLEGRVVAADFTVRQLTHIELLLGAAGATGQSLAVWDRALARFGGAVDPGENSVEAIDICHLLDDARRAVWNEQGLLRPPSGPTDGTATSAVPKGEDKDARIAAQHEACLRMAEAQAMWEAAATEPGWRAWNAARGADRVTIIDGDADLDAGAQ